MEPKPPVLLKWTVERACSPGERDGCRRINGAKAGFGLTATRYTSTSRLVFPAHSERSFSTLSSRRYRPVARLSGRALRSKVLRACRSTPRVFPSWHRDSEGFLDGLVVGSLDECEHRSFRGYREKKLARARFLNTTGPDVATLHRVKPGAQRPRSPIAHSCSDHGAPA